MSVQRAATLDRRLQGQGGLRRRECLRVSTSRRRSMIWRRSAPNRRRRDRCSATHRRAPYRAQRLCHGSCRRLRYRRRCGPYRSAQFAALSAPAPRTPATPIRNTRHCNAEIPCFMASSGERNVTSPAIAAPNVKSAAILPARTSLNVRIAVHFRLSSRVGYSPVSRRPDLVREFPQCPRLVHIWRRFPDGAPPLEFLRD